MIENSRMAGHNGEQVLTDVRSSRIRVIQATSTLATRSGPACMHSRALVKKEGRLCGEQATRARCWLLVDVNIIF